LHINKKVTGLVLLNFNQEGVKSADDGGTSAMLMHGAWLPLARFGASNSWLKLKQSLFAKTTFQQIYIVKSIGLPPIIISSISNGKALLWHG